MWIVKPSTKPKVLKSLGYPGRMPKPRADLYEVRSLSDMGQGVFAKHDIRRGEIIFAERPLLVLPEVHKQKSLSSILLNLSVSQQNWDSEFERLLEAAIAHLPPESQSDFRALRNVYTRDQCGPLLGITRNNNYDLRNLFDGSDMSENYNIVAKIAARINHRCVSLHLSFSAL